jgi:type III pantothenate kinase
MPVTEKNNIKTMLLAIDIGNTSIGIGIFDDKRLQADWSIATESHRSVDEYASLLLNLVELKGFDVKSIGKIVFCSVVPPLTAIFEKLAIAYFKTKPLIVEAGIRTGVKIRMDNPREVGPDRVVNAAAAHHLYHNQPVIVVDLGTATTFDTISKEGDYIGGAIAPGLVISAEALFEKTANLPRIELTPPSRAIGTDTITAMQSGIIFGYIGLIESIVSRIQNEIGHDARVIATGGHAELIASYTEVIEEVRHDLTLFGLQLIYHKNLA